MVTDNARKPHESGTPSPRCAALFMHKPIRAMCNPDALRGHLRPTHHHTERHPMLDEPEGWMIGSHYNRWRIAAALAYHLPGAGLLVHDGEDLELHVAPTTSLDANMHPGELRDILGLDDPTTALANVNAGFGLNPHVTLFPEVLPVSPVLLDCGLGLYRIGSSAMGGAFAFATRLDSNAANAAIHEHGTFADGGLELIARAGLGYDELLHVTMAIFEWQPGTPEAAMSLLENAVRSMQSACAVAEFVTELAADGISAPNNSPLDR